MNLTKKTIGMITIVQDGVLYKVQTPYGEILLVPDMNEKNDLLLYSIIDMLFNLEIKD